MVIGLTKTGTSAFVYSISRAFGLSVAFETVPSVCAGRATKLNLEQYPWSLGKWNTKTQSAGQYERVYLLIRDPRDRLISLWCYHWKHHSGFKDILPLLERKYTNRQVSMVQLCSIGAVSPDHERSLHETFIEFIDDHPGYVQVSYQEFVSGTLVCDGKDIVPGDTGPVSYVKRTATFGDWRRWFTREDVDLYRPIFKPFMDKVGLDDDWELSEESIGPEESAEYILGNHPKP